MRKIFFFLLVKTFSSRKITWLIDSIPNYLCRLIGLLHSTGTTRIFWPEKKSLIQWTKQTCNVIRFPCARSSTSTSKPMSFIVWFHLESCDEKHQLISILLLGVEFVPTLVVNYFFPSISFQSFLLFCWISMGFSGSIRAWVFDYVRLYSLDMNLSLQLTDVVAGYWLTLLYVITCYCVL